MGAPKQKWTPDEEAALRAGVGKYGPGKWRAIQKDPTFGPCLTQRSNVDLKDKWRNMSVSANGGHKSKALVVYVPPKAGASSTAATPGALPAPSGSAGQGNGAIVPYTGAAPPANGVSGGGQKKASSPKYEEYILAAVSALKEKNGSSNTAIAKYIEDNHSVPPNFRRILASRLRSLTEEGKLIKLKQLYRLSDASFSLRTGERLPKVLRRENQDAATAARRTPRPPKDFGKFAVKGTRSDGILKGPRLVKAKPDFLSVRETAITAEEAARVAAQAVAEAEAAAAAAEQAARAAELAEAEAEAAEAAAEAAAAAVRPPKKRTNAKLKP